MAIVLDATPGGSTANSFTTVEYSNIYHSGRLYAEAWDEAESDIKKRALITATRLISEALMRSGVQGIVSNTTQRLPVPRAGIVSPAGYPIDATIIPSSLQDATAEYAFRLIESGKMPDTASETDGIKSLKAGPINIEFTGEGSGASTELPDAVWNMISWMIGSTGGRTIVPLVRV